MDIGSVKKAYRRYAPGYDLCFGALLTHGRRKTVEKMKCLPGDAVLEVGVGTGLSLPLYDRRVRVVGIDVSPEMLARAKALKEREKLHHVTDLQLMDAQQMAFDDSSFDKVVAMYVVSVVPDAVKLVQEMRRVCKPGGELFIVNHFQNSNPVISCFERVIAPFSGLIGFRPDFSLDQFLSDTGLNVRDKTHVNFCNYWTMLRAVNEERHAPNKPSPEREGLWAAV